MLDWIKCPKQPLVQLNKLIILYDLDKIIKFSFIWQMKDRQFKLSYLLWRSPSKKIISYGAILGELQSIIADGVGVVATNVSQSKKRAPLMLIFEACSACIANASPISSCSRWISSLAVLSLIWLNILHLLSRSYSSLLARILHMVPCQHIVKSLTNNHGWSKNLYSGSRIIYRQSLMLFAWVLPWQSQ